MRRVTVTDLKNRLSQYLRLVKQGETIEVLERSFPIARLEGLPAGAAHGNETFRRLVREGVVTEPRHKPDPSLLARPPVPCRGDAVRALVEERGDR